MCQWKRMTHVFFHVLGSVSGSINTLDLSPCDSDPCVLKKGNNYTATVNFTSSKYHFWVAHDSRNALNKPVCTS